MLCESDRRLEIAQDLPASAGYLSLGERLGNHSRQLGPLGLDRLCCAQMSVADKVLTGHEPRSGRSAVKERYSRLSCEDERPKDSTGPELSFFLKTVDHSV